MNSKNDVQQTKFLAKWSQGGSTTIEGVEEEYDTLAQVYEETVLDWN